MRPRQHLHARARVLLLLGMCAACVSPRAATRTSEAPRDPRGQVRTVALQAGDFADLAFLAPLLEGKRIVQLGENTHGTREYNLLKARVVRFLHEELGYDVLAFESSIYQCFDADRSAAQASARATLLRCAFGVWHTAEVLPLFEYLRGTREGARPLHLAGIDIQPIGGNKEQRPEFLSRIVAAVDTGYAAAVAALDSAFLRVYARDGDQRRAYFRSTEGQRMAEDYDLLAAFIARNAGSIGEGGADGDAMRIARQTASSMARYIRQQAAPTTREYVERRDEGMARNLMFLADELYPGKKIIVWAHNFHVRHDNVAIPPDSSSFPDVAVRTMGSWIRERYGEAVYTIGLYAYQGRAANNSGEIFDIAPAPPGTLERLVFAEGAEASFVDFSQAPGGPETAWMNNRIGARYNGTTVQALIPKEQYDAVVVVARVTPRVMLY